VNISFVNIDVCNFIIFRKCNVEVIFLNFSSNENRLGLQYYKKSMRWTIWKNICHFLVF